MAAVEDTTTPPLAFAGSAAATVARLGGSAEDVRVVRSAVARLGPDLDLDAAGAAA